MDISVSLHYEGRVGPFTGEHVGPIKLEFPAAQETVIMGNPQEERVEPQQPREKPQQPKVGWISWLFGRSAASTEPARPLSTRQVVDLSGSRNNGSLNISNRENFSGIQSVRVSENDLSRLTLSVCIDAPARMRTVIRMNGSMRDEVASLQRLAEISVPLPTYTLRQ